MLATISPSSIHLDETMATLRYACQARTIVNRVRVNEDPHSRRIRELHAEIERLRIQALDYERQKRHSGAVVALAPRKIIIETTTDEAEVQALRQRLDEADAELCDVRRQLAETQSDLEHAQLRLSDGVAGSPSSSSSQSEVRMLRWSATERALRFAGGAQSVACLVNLAGDPLRGDVLLYELRLGVTKVGRQRPAAFEQPDIQLNDEAIAFRHWYVIAMVVIIRARIYWRCFYFFFLVTV